LLTKVVNEDSTHRKILENLVLKNHNRSYIYFTAGVIAKVFGGGGNTSASLTKTPDLETVALVQNKTEGNFFFDFHSH